MAGFLVVEGMVCLAGGQASGSGSFAAASVKGTFLAACQFRGTPLVSPILPPVSRNNNLGQVFGGIENPVHSTDAGKPKFGAWRQRAARWRGPLASKKTALAGYSWGSYYPARTPPADRPKIGIRRHRAVCWRGLLGCPEETALARYSGGWTYRASPTKSGKELPKKRHVMAVNFA